MVDFHESALRENQFSTYPNGKAETLRISFILGMTEINRLRRVIDDSMNSQELQLAFMFTMQYL